jgi:serine phosphatase RsbU (regulator of sigma subunit)
VACYNITARKNYEIQIQNQNEDIMASIEYAQRIQVAMLPTRESMAAHLSDFFMLYMPKDIVSGDFYWFEVKEDKIFAIAVDCTGHGVPGAFMSMLGNETLHEIIGLRNVYESHEIIKLLHLHIRKALKQHNNQNHEGMDIGVAVIDKTRGVLEFAGAGNTMWLVQEGEIQDVRGNWKGVGGYEIGKTIQYEPNFFTLLPNTVFYLLSDGYIDQFGGAQGKKFGTKRFKAMLQQHYALPMQEQENVFRQAFEDWRAESNDKQVDDIMLWGIKV